LTKLQAGYLFPEVLFDALHKLQHLSEYPFVASSLVLKTHFDRWTITAYCGPYCNAMVDRKCSVPAEAAHVTDDGRLEGGGHYTCRSTLMPRSSVWALVTPQSPSPELSLQLWKRFFLCEPWNCHFWTSRVWCWICAYS
jgi:hypothetical protein